MSLAGSLTTTPPSGDAGAIFWPGNTANQSIPANQFAIGGFSSASATAYGLQPSNTAPSGNQVLYFGTPSSSWSQGTWISLAGSGSGLTTGPTSGVTSGGIAAWTGTSGQITSATAANLGSLIDVAQYGVLFSTGATSAVSGIPADFYYNDTGYDSGPTLQIGVRGSQPVDAHFEVYGSNDTSAHFHNYGSTGTGLTNDGGIISLSAVPTGAALGSGVITGNLQFGGSDNTSDTEATGAAIASFTTQAWTTSAFGSSLRFYTVPNSSTTLGQAMKIDQDGSVTVGANTVASEGAGTINVSGGYYVNGTQLVAGANLRYLSIQTLAGTPYSASQTLWAMQMSDTPQLDAGCTDGSGHNSHASFLQGTTPVAGSSNWVANINRTTGGSTSSIGTITFLEGAITNVAGSGTVATYTVSTMSAAFATGQIINITGLTHTAFNCTDCTVLSGATTTSFTVSNTNSLSSSSDTGVAAAVYGNFACTATTFADGDFMTLTAPSTVDTNASGFTATVMIVQD